MPEDKQTQHKKRAHKKLGIALAFLITACLIGWALINNKDTPSETADISNIPTYSAARNDLSVTVSAGGTIQAMDTTEIECQVEGQTQILDIVKEGTILTEQDVENEKTIVRLDSSSMEDQSQQQEIQVANAEAAFKSARENLNIQKQENESNISQAKLKVEFARMDLEKYVGKKLARKIINTDAEYADLRNNPDLGGEAEVKKDNLESEINLAEEELTRSEETLKWTKKLVEKGYVNRNEQDADQLQLKTRKSKLRQARANLQLFLEYTLPKQVEQYASDLREARRELERVKARARSQLAQAQSELRTKQSTYQMKKQRLEELKQMIANCTINAPEPGLVVYASTSQDRRYNSNPIEEGQKLREGQTIITIPDLKTMAAEVDIPEGDIKSVQTGQKAVVTVEAIPDKSWQGRVEKVSAMASSKRRFGPDVRVYKTVIKLDGRVTDLKPGMSTTAEIYVAELENVLTVPIQAVTTFKGERAVWVKDENSVSIHQVKTGHYSDTKVEIRAGLSPGDKVLLASPQIEPANVEYIELPTGKGKTAGNNGEDGT